MSQPPFTRLVTDLPATIPFIGPERQERARGRVFRARIGANENAYGPSPRAIEAMAAAAAQSWKYCDPDNHELRAALSRHLGAPVESIAIGEGIDGLLGLTARMFLAPGDVAVTSAGGYPTFNYQVAGFGGRLHTVPYKDDMEDCDALIEAAHANDAKLVYLANPDNPMGGWHDAATVSAMIEALPENCVFCLDEAYAEFAPDGTAPALNVAQPNLIRFRTFSKAYALAGIRCGYAVTHPDIAAAFDRIRNHFGVSLPSQAGALAALNDGEHLERSIAFNIRAREEIARIADANGLRALPSATNFVAIDCGGDGALSRAVLDALGELDVFVRRPGAAPLDRCIRVSAGTDDDLALFAEALPQALAAARAAIASA